MLHSDLSYTERCTNTRQSLDHFKAHALPFYDRRNVMHSYNKTNEMH